MRVCPSCQSRFVGGETFCPHDGTKLVDARELSPGELTGSKLDGVVRLDKLAYSDPFAERYTGRLLESRRAVYVTVFNQKFRIEPAASKRVETARAKVGSPMPLQINTLLQTHFDKAIGYLVESEPRGPSVRTLLDEKRVLGWSESVRIIANAARAMQWLHEHGVPHCSFHPTSIFVTSLATGHVVVGDWALEALFPPDSAERLVEEDPQAFAGYIDYMAPEIARSTDKADIRSAVYALGCVLYEMVLGRVPLPGKSAAEVIKRHRHEKPVRLSIAVEGQDLPQQLDDIVEMMLAKDPDKRFQSPAAAIAALANLVGEKPDALAPALERASETDVDDLYRTIDMESVDRAELEQLEVDAHKATMQLRAPDTAKTDPELVTKIAVSGTSLTVDDTSLDQPVSEERRSTGQYNKPAAVLPDDETNDGFQPDAVTRPTAAVSAGVDDDSKRTLMMGSAITDAPPTGADDGKRTLLNFGGSPTEGPPKKLSRKQKKKLGKVPPPNGRRPSDPMLVTGDASPTDKTIRVNVDAEAIERQLAEQANPSAPPPSAAAPPPAAKSMPPDVEEAPEPAPKPQIALDAAAAASAGLTEGVPNIGFITPDKSRDATRDIDRSSWFSGDADDVWEKSLAQEAAESHERRNKTLVMVIAGALVVGALALIAYFEFFSTEEVTDEPVAAVAEAEKPAVDLDEIQAAFTVALEANRIIEPIGNSAQTHLESLKRHGADDPRYERARGQFVAAALDAAKAADKNGDLRKARALAGYASQFAPDDEELRTLTADLQARFTGALSEGADAGAADTGNAGAGMDTGIDAAEAEVEEPVVVAKRPDKPKPTSTKKPKKPRKPKKSGDAGAISRDARAAHTSGNLDQARKLYAKAIKINPKSTVALSGLGKVYFDKADYRQAVKYQTKAVRYAPGRNDYRISLGQSYYRLGKYSEAISVWEKVLARDPNNGTARQYVELAKRKLGR